MNNFLYLVPTIITSGNLFCGFLSVIMILDNKFEFAAWLILLALVLDGLDGAIARLKGVDNMLGVELDSLADIVSFCVAPMVLVYRMFLYRYPPPAGILLAFIFVLFGCIRLAKFNVEANKLHTPNIFFEGLPTPAAAGIIVSIILLFLAIEGISVTKRKIPLLLVFLPTILKFFPVIILVLSVLMVSRLRYIKFSRLKLNQRVTLRMFTLIVGGVMLIFAYPESSVFLVFAIYVLSGLIDYLIRLYKFRIQIAKYKKVMKDE